MFKIIKRPFSLIEMVIVVAVILVLLSLLQPALRKAIDSALQAKCMNNQRQILVGYKMYEDDNNGFMPVVGNNKNQFNMVWLVDVAPYIAPELEDTKTWPIRLEDTIGACPNMEKVGIGMNGKVFKIKHKSRGGLGGNRFISHHHGAEEDHIPATREKKIHELGSPSETLSLGDVGTPGGHSQLYGNNNWLMPWSIWQDKPGISRRHNGGLIVSWADAHSSWQDYTDIGHPYISGNELRTMYSGQ